MKMKVLIADDEEHIRIELKYIIDKIEDLEVVSICSSGDEAMDEITDKNPDIVFLDIDMPVLNGIKLGNYLKKAKNPPYIVYVTAHEKYAVDAFKVGAKAYILKPFAEEEILEQINNAKKYFFERKTLQSYEESKENKKSCGIISGEIDGKIYPIDEKDIKLVYSKNREVYLLTDKNTLLTHYTLSELEQKLSSDIFFRCHRKYLVNMYKIKEINPWFKGAYLVIIDHPEKIEVPVSRSKVKEFKAMIGIL
jgi:DNA-binding LytR/AlgR family response regulator